MQITGKLYKKFDVQNITENFSKREFILLDDTNPNYPQYIKFELYNNSMSLIDNIEENSTIVVDFNIKGREYQKNGVTSYFNSLVAYSVKLYNDDYKETPNSDKNKNENPPKPENNEELPF